MKKSALVVLGGAALAVACLFLPWISVTVMGMSFSVTGLQMASGQGMSEMSSLAGSNSDASLYLLPALAVIAAVVAFLGQQKMSSKNVGMTSMALGVAGILFWAYKVMGWNGEFTKSMESAAAYGIKMSFWSVVGMGLWGTVIGLAVIAVGGFLMTKEGDSQPTAPVEPTPPPAA